MNEWPTTLRQDAEKMAAFILKNYPDSKQWDQPVEKAAWYISHAFVAVVCGDDGEIVALCAARPVERPGLGVLPYYFNEGGTCLHVDLWCDISGDDRARIGTQSICVMAVSGVQDDHDVQTLRGIDQVLHAGEVLEKL